MGAEAMMKNFLGYPFELCLSKRMLKLHSEVLFLRAGKQVEKISRRTIYFCLN